MGFLVVMLLAGGLGGCSAAKPGDGGRQTVTMGGRTFHLELAMTDQSRYRGLSDRKSIAADGGMLFVFPQPEVATFVMRRCYVPIDIVFLDPGGRVVRTYHMTVEPYDTPEWKLTPYSSVYPAQFVIELRGGALDGLGLERGQKVDLPLEELKRRAR